MSITFVLASLYMWRNKTEDFPFGKKEVRLILMARGLSGFFGVFGMYCMFEITCYLKSEREPCDYRGPCLPFSRLSSLPASRRCNRYHIFSS